MKYALRHPIRRMKRLRIRELQVGSAVSGFFFLVLSMAYARPDEFVRAPVPPTPPGQTPRINVVSYIEQATVVPVWAVLFAISFAALMVAAVRDKYGPKSHLIGGVSMSMYAAANFATAFVNPGTYIVTATFATAFAFAQFMLQANYVHRHERISELVTESSAERAMYRAEKKAGPQA